MKQAMRACLCACFLPGLAAFARAYDLPLSTGTHRVVFSAEQGDLNEYTKIINLRGNVQLDEIGPDEKLIKTIKADSLTVNSSGSTVNVPEAFTLYDTSVTVRGESGSFNYSADTGYIAGGKFNLGGLHLSGSRVDLKKGSYLYHKADITPCSEMPPHVKVKATSLKLVPEKYFLSYNNIFYLGSVPVLYLPILYKPLIPGTPFVSSFRLGHDGRNGYFIKSAFSYKFTQELKGKLYLDYFEKKGTGAGGEFDYRKPGETMAGISAYEIKESSGSDRWGINGGYWKKFSGFIKNDPAVYYSQSSFKLLSDPLFNNDYFKSNPFAITPYQQASISFSRQTDATITRASAEVRYENTADMLGFKKSYISAPRLDFQKLPFTIGKIPVLHSFNGSFENAMQPGITYYQKHVTGTWTISKSIPLVRRLTLLPSVYYNQSVLISTSSETNNEWIGRYGTVANLRYDTRYGSLDFRHSFQARMKQNNVAQDTAAADHGEETNALFAEVFTMPSYNTYFRSNISYDLRSWQKANLSRKLTPLFSEFSHSPLNGITMFLQDLYVFGEGNRSVIGQIFAGDKQNYFGLGVTHYDSQPNTYVLNQLMGLKAKSMKTWRLEAVLRYEIKRFPDSGDSLRFFEKGLSLYKDFHDFRTSWFFRSRKGVRDFSFLINMKLGDGGRQDSFEETSRNIWHPWRQPGDLRD